MSTVSVKRDAQIAVLAVFMMGGADLFIGILRVFRLLHPVGFASIEILVGLVYLGLGFFALQMRSIPLVLAIAVTILLGLLTLISYFLPADAGESSLSGGIGLPLFCLFFMVRGYDAMKSLEHQPYKKRKKQE